MITGAVGAALVLSIGCGSDGGEQGGTATSATRESRQPETPPIEAAPRDFRRRMAAACRRARPHLSPRVTIGSLADRASVADDQLSALRGMRKQIRDARIPGSAREAVLRYLDFVGSSIAITDQLRDVARLNMRNQAAALLTEQRVLRTRRARVAHALHVPHC